MWVVFLLLLSLLFSATPALAESGFSDKYERDYSMFNPINEVHPDNLSISEIRPIKTPGLNRLTATSYLTTYDLKGVLKSKITHHSVEAWRR